MCVVGVGKQQIYALQAISVMHVPGHNFVLVPLKLSFFANQQAGGGQKVISSVQIKCLVQCEKECLFW